MPGKIVKVEVKAGQSVVKGEVLVIVEAMKMENSILAPFNATIEQVLVAEGEQVMNEKELIRLSAIKNEAVKTMKQD
jgi:3-methylcrotonyl-CoA carboxylase alpha subunit